MDFFAHLGGRSGDTIGIFAGLLGGFLGRKGEIEQQNLAEAQRSQAREQQILGALVNADDPEVRSLAIAGLLHAAQPGKRKGGFKGWLGEMEASPFLPQIQSLINTPITEANPAVGAVPTGAEIPATTLPSRQSVTGLGLPSVQPSLTETPNAAAPLAQPATALTEQKGVAPPPTPTAVTSAPPIPYTVQHPRQVFLSPMDRYTQEAITKAGADVAGDVAAYTELFGGGPAARAKAIEIVRQERLRKGAGAAGQSYAEGNVEPDPLSPTGYSQILYLRADPKQTTRIPAQPPTYMTRSFGQDRESISREPQFGGKPYFEQPPEVQAAINAELQKREVSQAGAVTGARATANNLAFTQKWLDPTEAAKLGVPIGSSMADLQGFTPLTEDQRKRKDAVLALAPQMTNIETLVRQVIPPGVSALQASAVIAQKRLRRDPTLAQLEGEIARAQGNVARVLAAESGRLTQPDVERAMKSLADISGWTDTQESALARLSDVSAAMDKILADLRQSKEPSLGGPNGPPPPKGQQVPGMFVGADGQLHTGSPSGPVYQPGAAPATASPTGTVPFNPQTIRPVR